MSILNKVSKASWAGQCLAGWILTRGLYAGHPWCKRFLIVRMAMQHLSNYFDFLLVLVYVVD